MFAESDGARLHYESAGSGEPVLLIMGLGMSATMWWRTIPVLAERHRVIAFDNRGAGRSDCTPGLYTVAQLAADAAAVLDAAGEASAHVYGLSLGGIVAQALALSSPDRVRSLVLGATTPGGLEHEAPDADTLAFLRRRTSMPADEAAWASVPYTYARRTRERDAGRIGEDVVQRLRFPASPDGYRAQLAAVWGWDATKRLPDLRLPALVVHGAEDRMVPVSNGRRLADTIPGARLVVLDDAAHLFPTDEPEADREVFRFLRDLPQPAADAAAAR
jgi:pimeloyl-ACP methyl ester carboxylesterase